MNYIEIRDAVKKSQPVSFSPEMAIFTHHFPQSPLLPGALSAHILTETCGGPEWSLKKINGLRFRKPLTPRLPVTVSCQVISETATEKVCSGKIQSEVDTIADGEFVFAQTQLPRPTGARSSAKDCLWNGSQIRSYLPHGEPIVLIDELIEARYPSDIQNELSSRFEVNIDQTKLIGTKIHARSVLKPDNFWLDENLFPSSILNELVAQAGALTLAPFFKGTKPQVSLLGCDTEYFAIVEGGSTLDTFLELARVKKLGKNANMIIFHAECFVGDTKIAEVNLNAMASL